MHMIALAALVAIGAGAFAGAAFAQPAPAPWNPSPSITASLDVGGTGNFTGVIDKGQLCYMINAAGVANPTAAVIRSGNKSDNGAVVMNLRPPVGGSVGDCTPVAPDLARKLVRNSHDYWFEIDSAQYPQGAAGAWLLGQNG
ncbi:MAG: CHRD domain-containing protein [Reyranella sp.]